MPARKPRPMRTVTSVSFPADTARLVARAAAVRHQTHSEFCRDAAVEKANRVLGIERVELTPAGAEAVAADDTKKAA